MVERDFQTLFLKWLRHQKTLKSGAFELKLTKKESLPFKALSPHQLEALRAVKHTELAYKIADDSIGYKPFDCFLLKDAPAFIVVSFYKRGEKKFYMIDVDVWDKEILSSSRESITRERAEEIGLTCLLNKVGCTQKETA